MPLEWLFGRRMTPEETLRKNKRALDKAVRDLDRERTRMEQQEKKIIADIKKTAKDGQMDAVRIMAKDLVRTRNHVKKFMLMRANIQAVSMKIQTFRSQNAMAEAMKGVTKALQNMIRQLKLPQIQKILQEFEKQSEIMDMKEDVMNDAMDEKGDEEEGDAIVTQVLDELGLQLKDQLSGLPEAFLGGPCKVSIPEGGLIQKCFYKSDDLLHTLALSDESIYKSVTLTKGQDQEVVLLNKDLGSVITLDFDVLRHVICFSLYRTKNALPTTSTPSTPTTGSLQAACHDGESVQVRSVEQKPKLISPLTNSSPPFRKS